MPEKKRILIVDDDGDLCMQLGKIVEFFGYEPVLAANLAEGRKHFHESHIDVVICDLHLPDGMGTNFLHELHETKPDLPFIILTGYPTQETIRQTLIDGGYTYLAKPVPLDQLRQIIAHAFVSRE